MKKMRKMDCKHFRNGRINMRFLPVLVWAITVAGVVMVFSRQAQKFQVVGIAQQNSRQVSSTSTGLLKSVVALFTQVKKDQPVARLDDRHLQAQINTINSEIGRLKAELAATEDKLTVEAINGETESEAARRQFALDVERYHLRVLELQANLQPDMIRLDDLELEIKIEKDLLLKNAVATDYGVAKAQVAYDTLAKQIEETQRLLELAQLTWNKATERQNNFGERQSVHYTVKLALAPITAAIEVQHGKLAEINIQRDALTIKAPIDGVVSEIQGREGETVLPGQPIVTITGSEPIDIISFIGERQADRIEAGDTVEIVKNGDIPQVYEATIELIGPAIVELPVRLRATPDIPQWGRLMLIRIPPKFELIPGEAVGIRGI